MASSKIPNIRAYKAAGALAIGKVVKKGADDDHVVLCSAATDLSFGLVASVTTTAEDLVEIATFGGGAKGLAGGTIAQGAALTSDASGLLVSTTTENDRIIAVAMEDAVSGDLFDVEVVFGVH